MFPFDLTEQAVTGLPFLRKNKQTENLIFFEAINIEAAFRQAGLNNGVQKGPQQHLAE